MTLRHAILLAGLVSGALAPAAFAEDGGARPAAPVPAEAPPGPGWTPPPPAQEEKYPDCFCTNRGARVEMGGLACLSVGGETFTARCAMSLNNPVWRREKTGCETAPSASLAPLPGQPAFGSSIRPSQSSIRLAFTPRSEWP